ncbi:hypothetical protein BDV59DRAFT_176636 [Aspergillus ambiguus]|uniref:TMEM53 family protein n=1 Tax=Aspergillus ambiguus TaxID=176160 RepID=UPI003CCD6E40
MSDCMMDASSLEEFAQLNPNIYFHEPTSAHVAHPHPVSPTLIILCTWLGGATIRRISKYTSVYQQRFPSAYILLITANLSDISFRSFQAIRRRLAPAREAISRHFPSTSNDSTLLHVFSHGGCNNAIQLVRSMNDESHGFSFLKTLRLVVFDCCPGDTAFCRSYKAAALSLPSTQPANRIGRLLLYPTIGMVSSLQHMGVMNSVADLRSELNDPTLFGTAVRRLYLYSEEDEMVRWPDVEQHMDGARVKGFPVDGARFEQGPHCALVMADGTRYWTAIERAWRHASCGGDHPAQVVEKCKL